MSTYTTGNTRRARNWYAASASVNLGSSGPSRVDTQTPDPEFKPRPAGFTAQIEPLTESTDACAEESS